MSKVDAFLRAENCSRDNPVAFDWLVGLARSLERELAEAVETIERKHQMIGGYTRELAARSEEHINAAPQANENGAVPATPITTVPAGAAPEPRIEESLDFNRLNSGDRRALFCEHQPVFDAYYAALDAISVPSEMASSEALKLAEEWKGRGDDAGRLSRAVIDSATSATPCSGWRDASKSSPEKEGTYLTLKRGDVPAEISTAPYYKGEWIWGDGTIIRKTDPDMIVEWWMPLPEAPHV